MGPDNPDHGDDFEEFTRGASSAETFGELQEEVDELSPDGLVEDPSYLDFLDHYGELEMQEDSMSLDDLLGGPDEVDDDTVESDDDRSWSADGGTEHRRDDERRITEGDDDRVALTVDGLIEALEDERVTDTERAELREALGIRDRRQVEVQLNYLKSRFLDLEAYLQAMEDLFEADTDLLEEVEDLHANLAAVREDIATQRERLDQFEADIEALKEDGGRRDGELATVERRLDETNDTLERNLSAIESELNSARQWREDVTKAFRMADPDTNGE